MISPYLKDKIHMFYCDILMWIDQYELVSIYNSE